MNESIEGKKTDKRRKKLEESKRYRERRIGQESQDDFWKEVEGEIKEKE